LQRRVGRGRNTTQGRPIDTAIDKTFAAKFQASHCGSVKPLVVSSSPKK
jgi:hypothetical protein